MTIKIGYWYAVGDARTEGLPVPIPTSIPVSPEFLQRLEYIIVTPLHDVDIVGYLGYSRCRLCCKCNGDSDIIMPKYTFPDGLLHYYRDHNVTPDPDFMDYIIKFVCVPEVKKVYCSHVSWILDGMAGIHYTF